MKAPESTFPGGLLNREEISFLLRPADKSGLQTLIRSRNADRELFAGRLAAACSQRLTPLFFRPLSVAAEIGNFDEEPSVGFVFSAGGRKIACRLTKADTALLAALTLGDAPAAGHTGFRGISLAITRRLLKTLAETAAETLAENDEPKGKMPPSSLCRFVCGLTSAAGRLKYFCLSAAKKHHPKTTGGRTAPNASGNLRPSGG